MRFFSAVAEFAEVLRNSPHVASVDLNRILQIADTAQWFIDTDPRPDRAEFVELVRQTQAILSNASIME